MCRRSAARSNTTVSAPALRNAAAAVRPPTPAPAIPTRSCGDIARPYSASTGHGTFLRARPRADSVGTWGSPQSRRVVLPVDNELYDRLSHTWWDDGFLSILK